MSATYNMGIKNLKRLLKKNNNLTGAEKHKVIKIYKGRITDRLKEVAEYMKEIDKNE